MVYNFNSGDTPLDAIAIAEVYDLVDEDLKDFAKWGPKLRALKKANEDRHQRKSSTT